MTGEPGLDRAGGRRGPRRALLVAGVATLVVLGALLVPPAPAGPAGPAGTTDGRPATPTDASATATDARRGAPAGGVGGSSGRDGDAGATRNATGEAVRAGLRRAHAAGVTGEGVTVGVVDVTGFDVAHPALDGRLRDARAFAPGDDVFAGGRNDHGTATAVAVARVAPDAEIYLATFDRPAGFRRAVEWLAGRGVDVVVAPVAAYGVADDGTSATARAAADAAAGGATVVVPTGNLARGHWEGPYRPTDRGRHRFGEDDGTTRTWLQPRDRSGFRTAGRLTAWLSVDVLDGRRALARGDGAPAAGDDAPTTARSVAPDLELALYRANASEARLVATSDPAADGVAGERLAVDLEPGLHYLVVRAEGGNGSRPARVAAGVPGVDAEDVRIEVASPTHDLSRRRAAGSVVAPATAGAPGVVSVGALDGPAPAPYSSRGPTADGRPGVDVAAPAAGWTALDARSGADGAAGTSAAAAAVGGTAALILEANPSLSPARVELLLRSSATDLPPTGPDVATGHGVVAPDRAVRRARRLPGGTEAGARAGARANASATGARNGNGTGNATPGRVRAGADRSGAPSARRRPAASRIKPRSKPRPTI
jgi:hypothetical protein